MRHTYIAMFSLSFSTKHVTYEFKQINWTPDHVSFFISFYESVTYSNMQPMRAVFYLMGIAQ